MKIRTCENLEEILTQELAWRKYELVNLKLMHDSARDHQQEMLRRAGIALLYAHWEGFVKAAGTAYVQYVANQRLKYRQLTPNFIALGAKKDLVSFAASSRGAILCRISDFFVNGLDAKARINWEAAVDTKSNLSGEIARDIIAILGLNYKPFEVHEKTVIECVRIARNSVAHGQYLSVSAEEYGRLHKVVLELLDEINIQICNAAHERSYCLAGTS
jgi:hypothetical protein